MKVDLQSRYEARGFPWSEVPLGIAAQGARGIAGTVVAHLDCKRASEERAR
jgi:hypothetical protein